MKKIRCRCGLYFKDRKDDNDTPYEKKHCWNCRLVIKILGSTITALGLGEFGRKLNRRVELNMDHVKIVKPVKKNYEKPFSNI